MSRLGLFPKTRLRRLRQHATLRHLIRETHFTIDHLVLPLFIRHGEGIKEPVSSMPGHYQLSVDKLPEEIKKITELGIKSVMLFGIQKKKDPFGKDSYAEDGIIQTAIPVIKQTAKDLLIMSDICFCEYTDHGHCGVVLQHETGQEVDVHNDQTLHLLKKQAVRHAQAGTHVIAPSGNIDGMVGAIREALDEAGFHSIPILSYSVKYASAMYGPFRQATEGAPKFGDRRTYQMDVANSFEAIRECELDIAEGADMLMVKPAHTYLDVICRVKEAYPSLPLAAYHTSGEFAMIKAAAKEGWMDERKGVMEVLTSIRRAGADFIITYYAKEVAEWLK